MLEMKGKLIGHGDPIEVKVLINVKNELGKMPDRPGEIVASDDVRFAAGERYILELDVPDEVDLNSSMPVFIDNVSDECVAFAPTTKD